MGRGASFGLMQAWFMVHVVHLLQNISPGRHFINPAVSIIALAITARSLTRHAKDFFLQLIFLTVQPVSSVIRFFVQ